jgi:CRP/FNR family cyclic AMP-dependent transcriptional regulator
MNQEIQNHLKKTSLFKGLSDDMLNELAQSTTTRKLEAGEVLMRKGEEADSLFIINEGWFKIVTVDKKGDELIINKCGPGEIIGEMALLDSGPRSASVIALEDSEALELKREAFQDVIDSHPEVSLSIIRSYSNRLRFSTTYIERAIDWSQKIAEGDYSFMENTGPVSRNMETDDDKATQLLSAFFTMVRRVKEREDVLKQQLEQLTFEIDQARRKQEFEEITSTEFYAKLKEQAKTLRQQRAQQ